MDRQEASMVNKSQTEKARKRVVDKIRRELRKGSTARQISDMTGYTTARVYQIRDEMRASGELKQ